MKQKGYKKGQHITLPISKHIDVNFRDYAIYVLENRGIPSFYDGLTNVQKFIVNSAPSTYGKTISLVGKCIENGYHHGNMSIEQAINKITKPFGCANKLMDGDGFFGTPVEPSAAASRYTSVKLNHDAGKVLKKYGHLNTKSEDGQWDPMWLEVPVGLCAGIVGIAVGYKSMILPRSIEDMQLYLGGKIDKIAPSFINYNGKVTQYGENSKTWLLEGKYTKSIKNKSLHITSIPPLMKYSAFLNKLESIRDEFPKITISNNSTDNIDITIVYRGRLDKEFKELSSRISKITKMIVTETIVLIKDNSVLVYDSVESYLDDYKYRVHELNLVSSRYDVNVASSELEFNKAKKLYLEFMLAKRRNDEEVKTFINKFPDNIPNRLDSIRLRFLTKEELKRVNAEIKKLTAEVKSLTKTLKALEKIFNKLKDPTQEKGTKSKSKNTASSLFDESDVEYYDGIEVFDDYDYESETI